MAFFKKQERYTDRGVEFSFEKIYALEKVDLKTVRKISEGGSTYNVAKVSATTKNRSSESANSNDDIELDLFENKKMSAFILEEPIERLKLSEQAMQNCINNNISTIGDIIELKSTNSFDGIACGHIDELIDKCKEYVGDSELYDIKKIDFISFLKCIIGDSHSLSVYLILKQYGLEGLVSLNNGDFARLKIMKNEELEALKKEGIAILLQQSKKTFVTDRLIKIFDCFFYDWMMSRYGIANYNEIIERLIRISSNSDVVMPILNLIQDIYFASKPCFSIIFNEIDEYLYACDDVVAYNYRSIIERAYTYFYSTGLYYNLNRFISMIEIEFARDWVGFDEGFVEYSLKISPSFRVRKLADGKLYIYCA